MRGSKCAETVKLLSPGVFDDEAEEVREVANRIVPEMKLIVIPDDLGFKDVGEKKELDLVEYLKEQVENLFG